jgi:hypothetical protein
MDFDLAIVRIARHSCVNSSMMLSMRNLRPRWVRIVDEVVGRDLGRSGRRRICDPSVTVYRPHCFHLIHRRQLRLRWPLAQKSLRSSSPSRLRRTESEKLRTLLKCSLQTTDCTGHMLISRRSLGCIPRAIIISLWSQELLREPDYVLPRAGRIQSCTIGKPPRRPANGDRNR